MDFILKDFLFKKKWAPNIPGSNSTYIIRIMGTSVRNVGGEFKKKKPGRRLDIGCGSSEPLIHVILDFANFLLRYFM